MAFNALRFLQDYEIEHTTEHHHCTIGWVMVKHCPFCNSYNFHLGMHLVNGVVNCWRCGRHSLRDTIRALLNCTFSTSSRILAAYSEYSIGLIARSRKSSGKKPLQPCEWPVGILPELTERHKKYLEARHFNPDAIVRDWNIRGTGIVGDYKFRIIAPVHYKGVMVSYLGRDITGKASSRYKACASHNETLPHKHCLYGLDKVSDKKVVVVEGITDVWRLGAGAVATMGITWTTKQAVQLLNMDAVFILYDKDEAAQRQADKLAHLLSHTVKHVEVITLDLVDGKDPADMSQEDADNLMKELLG